MKAGAPVIFEDIRKKCRDCAEEFVFSAAEQEHYAQLGLVNQPQRCPACRANRRREKQGLAPRSMHQTVCAQCGLPTVVPFLPRNVKPVYCSKCFEQVRLMPRVEEKEPVGAI